MYKSLFKTFFADPLVSPLKIIYVVSDIQLEGIKCKQGENELENRDLSRKRLEPGN